jgi:hypothetical protein
MKPLKILFVMAVLLTTETLLGHLPLAEGKESPDQFEANSWRGKHNIQLGIGLLSDYGVETEASAVNVASIAGGEGLLGSIAYSYWARDDLAIGISVSVIGSEVSNSVSGSKVSSEASSVVPVLFGIKYQPLGMAISEGVRPYLFTSVGPCIGSATRSFTTAGLKNETYSETALASHFGLGINCMLSRLFVAGLSAGYYLATDFDRPIGGQKNYSSPEFTLLIGILLGGAKK